MACDGPLAWQGRPHLCLHCVFVGCLDGPAHFKQHYRETEHFLALDVVQRQIFCAACDDHVYDADMERIVAAQRCLEAEASLPFDRRRVPYQPWQPTGKRDADLLEKTAAAGGIVSTHYSFGVSAGCCCISLASADGGWAWLAHSFRVSSHWSSRLDTRFGTSRAEQHGQHVLRKQRITGVSVRWPFSCFARTMNLLTPVPFAATPPSFQALVHNPLLRNFFLSDFHRRSARYAQLFTLTQCSHLHPPLLTASSFFRKIS